MVFFFFERLRNFYVFCRKRFIFIVQIFTEVHTLLHKVSSGRVVRTRAVDTINVDTLMSPSCYSFTSLLTVVSQLVSRLVSRLVRF